MYKNKTIIILLPILLAVAFIMGMYLDSSFGKNPLAEYSHNIQARGKLDMVLNMINDSYVDSVNIADIEENTISDMIKDLDPHTVYIPAKDMSRVNEDMMGNFGGVGIQFYKYRDTVIVIKAIPNGPSQKAGIKDGDRVVQVDDSVVAGNGLEDKTIMALMRGPQGTNVSLKVVRRNESKPLEFNITRDIIPVKSVDVAYMITDSIGYIKVNTFGMNTFNEFVTGIDKLLGKGMKKLVVDLRDNEGGILPIALKMVNEFLSENKLILYTQGKASPRADYYSNGNGHYKNLPLTVLINENSASASEIFAGAIQDNDRGTIIGRRSFGKGLVQEQRMLPDGSAIRLTVARYYIPSGRSIQRPYDEGKEKYYNDIFYRAMHGELTQKDSIHFDENLRFQTVGGRVVYGGGGIMPDIFVPADTTGYTKYLGDLRQKMLIYKFSIDYVDRHRKALAKYSEPKALQAYLKRNNVIKEMANYAAKNGVPKNAKEMEISYKIIENSLEAYIARHILDDDGFYPIVAETDETLQQAIKNQQISIHE